ncbi:hypothetical protein M430DRAFT_19488 [Amorphotheca resinae ATCC 22711]|uniref:Uncharacterized protein n=1 Tax=Amorphotheca resinae ATCC 22711 TaxID=857342 RepID=A0A2T3AZB8_AMORE|nr:hypothetical protein M430DRAFT_19488 [Amorphotheca resinae ATCC 22711]PSS16500.1 hypothetical protein M430DRAFT_19488 [Amorphotheca resinae ATCC 22711]
MASFFNLTSNYSLYTIPAAWVVALAPHAVTLALAKSIDKTAPRTYAKSLESDQTLDKATKAKIHRCEGAQTNGFENIGLFAAAVIAGNIAGLPAETLNTLSGGYILSRIVYNYIYITGTTEAMASARTLAFFAGIGQVFALFIKSGNALRNRI